MSRLAADARRLLPAALSMGAWIGLLVYVCVFVVFGWTTFTPSGPGLLRELPLVLQYLALGLGFSLAVAGLAWIRGRPLESERFKAATAGFLVFAACSITAELSWLLTHRPIDPTSAGFLLATSGILALSAVAGLVASRLALRLLSAFAGRRRYLVHGLALVVALGGSCLGKSVVLETQLERAATRAGAASGSDSPPVVIVGMDGANWRLIEPMMRRGELPNLERLVRQGASGPLTSLEPIESPRIWTSIATGKTPEKHGIREFVVDRRFIQTSTLWEIADRAGHRVGLYDWLVTYPPQELDGFVIPGWLAGGQSTTHPPGLARTLFVRRSLRNPFWFLNLALLRLPAGYWQEANGDFLPRLVNSQFTRAEFIALDLPYLRSTVDLDLLALVFYGTDALAHSLWQYMEPEHFEGVDPEQIGRYGDVLPSYYRKVDAAIGELRGLYGDQVTYFVVSDHGFGPAPEVERLAYINGQALLREFDLLGVARTVGGAGNYLLIALNENGSLEEGDAGSPAGDELLVRILGDLNSVTSSRTGGKVFRAEPESERGADVRVALVEGFDWKLDDLVRFGEEEILLGRLLRPAFISGDHDLEGIVIIRGPAVRQDHRLDAASVLDVTPTVLYALGLPVGRDMDGKILTDAFTPEQLEERPPRFVDSHDAGLPPRVMPGEREVDAALLERLQALGYLE